MFLRTILYNILISKEAHIIVKSLAHGHSKISLAIRRHLACAIIKSPFDTNTAMCSQEAQVLVDLYELVTPYFCANIEKYFN